ncbi:MAG TPA: outer membrane beta-barrel protein [Bryobacteraceae bacterium]|nr:outer membrane beta-barrel protein [Bryobacteraceae bacterium]
MSRLCCLFLVFIAVPCGGQRIGFGVKGGVRPTNDIVGSATSESKRYVAGPMLDVSLPLGLGIEIDALYSRFGYRTATGGFWGSFSSVRRANVWEFPILAKYRLPFPLIKPYVSGGYALRRVTGSYNSEGYTVDLSTGNRQWYTQHGSWEPEAGGGAVIGGGVELGGRHFRIAPEVRYTRWSNDIINAYGSQGYRVNSALNQTQILLGLSWR